MILFLHVLFFFTIFQIFVLFSIGCAAAFPYPLSYPGIPAGLATPPFAGLGAYPGAYSAFPPIYDVAGGHHAIPPLFGSPLVGDIGLPVVPPKIMLGGVPPLRK